MEEAVLGKPFRSLGESREPRGEREETRLLFSSEEGRDSRAPHLHGSRNTWVLIAGAGATKEGEEEAAEGEEDGLSDVPSAGDFSDDGAADNAFDMLEVDPELFLLLESFFPVSPVVPVSSWRGEIGEWKKEFTDGGSVDSGRDIR